MSHKPTVVVIGGGFGGIAAVKKLKRAPVRTVLIDHNNYHLFAPLLYQVSTALLGPSEIAEPIRKILQPIRNGEFMLARVLDVDFEARRVHTDREDVSYDFLILAAGSETNFFGNKDLEAKTIGLKSLGDSLKLRNRVLSRFEDAKWAADPEARRSLLSFVVVGGGSSGIETAGALQELIVHVLRRDFREMDTSVASVTLLEASDKLLPPFAPRLQEAARRQLEKKGIRVMLNTALKEVRDDHVILSDGNQIPAGLVVWTAGVRAADLGAEISQDLGRGGAVKVGPTLQLPGHPEVFVVGDMAAVEWKGRQLPMIAPVASQGGKRAARNIIAMIKGEPPEDFKYIDKGMMSTIGRNSAVMQFGPVTSEGFFAWLSWLFVHLVLIVSGRSQLSIITNWLWNYIKNDRPARLIVEPAESQSKKG